MSTGDARLRAFFETLLRHPRLLLVLALVLALLAAAGLTRLVKDTSVDAFIPQDHPSLLAKDRAAERFGLDEPIAVAVLRPSGASVFDPETLALVERLTRAVEVLPNVRGDRVASLATESSIAGEDGAIRVDPYVDALDPAATDAAASEARWRAMAPHVDTLVAGDGSAALILAELLEPHDAPATVRAVQALAAEFQTPDRQILVAGPAAVSGFLAEKIDADARVLQPLVFLIVLAFLYGAFRRAAVLLGPLLVLLGSVAGALGIMAWQGVSYFAITNALPVILVAIAVADAIHVLSAYYQLRARRPELTVRQAVVESMVQMARPITLTTLTTVAGFLGIYWASIMPPISYFAAYAALGVLLAWLYSLCALPCALLLLRPSPSPAFRSWEQDRPDRLGRYFTAIAAAAARRPLQVLGLLLVLVAVAVSGAAQLRIDRSQVENFPAHAPVRVADQAINARFAGTAFLDVLIEADAPDALLDPELMARIAELQRFFETLPHVSKTSSIVDYLGLLHAAVEDQPPATGSPGRALPDSAAAIAQYLMVYEASGDPTDLEEEITPDYDAALVRGVLDTPWWSEAAPTVKALQRYVDEHFDDDALTVRLSGDVNIAHHWMSRLQRSHFVGVGISLALVLLMAVLVFRSVGAGVTAVLPVCLTVLTLYAVMGYAGIHLEPATSMFAAISVGVGVDFAIHLVDRLRVGLRLAEGNLTRAVAMAVPLTARACFFNAAGLGFGFAALLASDLPTLQRFGGLVSVAVFTSFVFALVGVPASYALGQRLLRVLRAGRLGAATRSGLAVLLALALAGGGSEAAQGAELNGTAIAERIDAREEGPAAQRLITMTLTDRRGRERERRAWLLRQDVDGSRRTRITYVKPKMVRELTYLSHEPRGRAGGDERWLYLPAARKVRRIPASDRGDYFLGTDFSYEDMQSDLKFDLADYRFRADGAAPWEGRELPVLLGEPVDERVARELGYGGFRALVDPQSWMPLHIAFSDPQGEPLKEVTVQELDRVDGFWTVLALEAVNAQTGHRTRFRFSEVAYPATLPEHWFEPAALTRGLPGALR